MRLVPSALSLALMGSALVIGQATKDLPESASGASTGPAVRFDNRVTVYRGATIEPVYNVKLAAKVTGTIIKVAVKEGQFVKADEVLVQLDDSIARAELEAKELAAKNDTAIKQSEKKVEEYQVRVEKEEQAYRRGASTEQDVRLNRVQLALEAEILKGKKYDQKIAEQDAVASAEKVRQHQLRAPIDGYVDKIIKNLGDGVQAGEVVVRLVQADRVKVRHKMPVSDAARIQAGMKVEVYPDYTQSEILALNGHTSAVRAIKVFDNGQQCVSGDDDGQIVIWNLQTGVSQATIDAHEGPITCIAISNNGKMVSCGKDGSIKLWDLKTLELIRTLSAKGKSVFAAAFHPQQQNVLVVGGEIPVLRALDLDSGNELKTFKGHSSFVRWLTIAPQGQYVLSASDDFTLRIWDFESGKEVKTVRGRGANFHQLSLTKNGKAYAFNSMNQLQIRSMPPEDKQIGSIMPRDDTLSQFAAFSPVDPQLVLMGTNDPVLQLWQYSSLGEQPRLVSQLEGHAGTPQVVDWTPNGRLAVSGDDQGFVRVWSIPPSDQLQKDRRTSTITFVEKVAETVSDTLVVYAEVDNKDNLFRPGQRATMLVYPTQPASAPNGN